METQKIVNLLNDLLNLQQENGTLLMTKIIENMAEEMKMIQPLSLKQKSNLCDYSDAYILVTGDKKVENVAASTNIASEIVLRLQDV